MDHDPQHFLPLKYQRHSGSFGGESHEQSIARRSPLHCQQQWNHTNVSLWSDSTACNGKRAREHSTSPTPLSDSESGTIQSSFKRLKVMDASSSNGDSVYSTITNHSSIAEPPASSDDAMAPQLQCEYHAGLASHRHNTGHLHQQHTESCQDYEQSAGQKSSEPSTSALYQSMNSMLGDLHLIRRQRMKGDQPTAQHPAPFMDHSIPQPLVGHPTSMGGGYSTSHKKHVSLRTSSKLY